jgi:photosystem II stability/assembly factor-like uncharacterized protein
MKKTLYVIIFFALTANVLAGDVLVMVEYGDPAAAYKLLDGGWRVVEVQPRFCLIRCMEEEVVKLPGAVVVADGPERVYLVWYPKGAGPPEAEGVRTVVAPDNVNLAIGKVEDVIALAAMGAELKYVGYRTVRPPGPDSPLRPVREDRFVRAMLENVTPERYQDIVETLSIGVTPSRYSHSPLIAPATNYIQTQFWEAGLDNVERWDYTYDPNDNDYVEDVFWLDEGHGWMASYWGYVWSTDDSGVTWTANLCGANLFQVEFTSADVGYAAGKGGAAFRTEDGGASWSEIDTGDYNGSLWGIDFYDSLHGIIVGEEATYFITGDGGLTWDRRTIPGAPGLNGAFYYDGAAIWVAAYDGKLYRSSDGGTTWEERSNGITHTDRLRNVWFHDPDNGVVCGHGGALYYTEDGGANWQPAAGGPFPYLVGMYFVNDDTGWVTGTGGSIYRTDNGGRTWTPQVSNVEEAILSVYFTDSNTGWAVGDRSTILKTDDGGNAWTPVDISNAEQITWENVVGEKRGTVNPDEVYIICGHYDSISEDPWHLAPGAEDNASGSGGVIAAAEAMGDYDFASTIRFIAFSGEEEGLIGSRAYAESMADRGEDIRAVLNMDMVSYMDEPVYDVQVMYNEPSQGLLDAFVDAAGIYSPTMKVYPATDRLGGSDHMSFWDNGYRAVLAIEQDNVEFYPWYHTTNDLPGNLHFDYGAEVVRCVAATAACLAGITDGPVPGLTDVIAYPNPARPGDAGITFANLPDGASLTLYNIAGERVFERSYIVGNETLWTLVNDRGNPVASGIYIYRVTDGDGNHATGKVAVIR